MVNVDTFMIFNGVDLSRYFVAEHVERTLLPSISNTNVKKRHIRAELSPTIIKVRIRLIEDDNFDLTEVKRKVAGKLYTEEPAQLVLYDDPTRYDMAILDGSTDFRRLWSSGETVLNFINPEGLSYTTIPTAKALLATDKVTINGTHETRPVFTVTIPQILTGFKISNLTTGQHVEITNQPLNTGNILIIDCQKELVTLNGNSIMPKVTIFSDFFALVPGDNNLTLTKAGSVTYHEAWL